jgi:hypothetical protein
MRTGASQWRELASPRARLPFAGDVSGEVAGAPRRTTSDDVVLAALAAALRSKEKRTLVRAISVASRLLGALRDVPSRC